MLWKNQARRQWATIGQTMLWKNQARASGGVTGRHDWDVRENPQSLRSPIGSSGKWEVRDSGRVNVR